MSEWLALRVEIAEDAADALAAFFFDEGCTGVITGVDDREAGSPVAGRTTVEVHVADGDLARVRRHLDAHLVHLASIDTSWGTATVEVAPVPTIDWTDVFRSHHHAMAIGRRLIVTPPWDDPRATIPDAGAREILVIEPGMAFGTGQHATTRTCLEEIETLVMTGRVQMMLDVGTGSGILAAAAARLGVPRVIGIDTDETVLPIARAMFAANRCAHILLAAGGAGSVRDTFDLVVANLLLDAIVGDHDAITRTVARGGTLVLSGLLDDQIQTVAARYAEWEIVHTRAEDRWRTLRCVRRA